MNAKEQFRKGQRVQAKWDNELALSGLNSDAPYPIQTTVIGFSRDPECVRLRRDTLRSVETWRCNGWEPVT